MTRRDLLPQSVTGHGRNQLISAMKQEAAWADLESLDWPEDVSFGFNLQWPSFFLPKPVIERASLIVLTFHTEPVDLVFIREMIDNYPDAKILILHDGYIEKQPDWPDRVFWARWITWGHQIRYVTEIWNSPYRSRTSKYHLSSLSHRIDLFKCYISAVVLQHPRRGDFLISWHRYQTSGTEKKLKYTNRGDPYLDSLAEWILNHDSVSADDWYNVEHNNPISNSNWDHPAYMDSVININNESFWHSFRHGSKYVHPGPFFTEKTWKPMIAGCPVLIAGQVHSHSSLAEVGFKFDYGMDLDFDLEPDDHDRVKKILLLLQEIADMDSQQLKSMVQPSADHNRDHAFSPALIQACSRINQSSLEYIHKVIDLG